MLIEEVRETEDVLAAGMSMEIFKVLFTLSHKEHLRAGRSSMTAKQLFKDHSEKLTFRTLEISSGKDKYPERRGKRLPLGFTGTFTLVRMFNLREYEILPFSRRK